MPDFCKDVRYGLRKLIRQPGFTVAALLALALGIGANTAIFSVADAVVFRPLPFQDPERLVMLWDFNTAQQLEENRLSPVTFLDYRGLDRVFEDAAARWYPQINLTDGAGSPVRVKCIEVSSNLFPVLGVSPVLGAGFQEEQLHSDELQVVISHDLWRARYGGDPDLPGRSVRLNGRAHLVVGVMPPGFNFPDGTQMWQLLRWDLSRHSRHAHFMESVARLQPGVPVEQASSELSALAGRLAGEYPQSNREWSARAVSLHQEIVGDSRRLFSCCWARSVSCS